MKRWYTLDMQTEPIERLDDQALEAFTEAIAAVRGIAGPAVATSSLTKTLSVRLSVEADALEDAFAVGAAALRRALKNAKLGEPGLSDVTAVRELPEDAFGSARDDLVGTPELAQRLGVTRQRVAQLVEQPGRFPAPVARVRGTHIWRWGDISDWLAAGQRDLRRAPNYASMTDEQLLALDRKGKSAAEEHLLFRGYQHDGQRWTKPKRRAS